MKGKIKKIPVFGKVAVLINRSLEFDKRNLNGIPNYTSIIIDAVK